ncbi:MAG TPA: sugar transferase [Vicinamibacterales bacterium]|nr:sugar transferase [Vicinamibacterales bacterium]
MRRAFDVAGACAGLLVFAPALAAISLAILIDDGRPVFFLQERVGWMRRPFRIRKFRTMRDGGVTRVGRVLRRTGLDEIPQFINIITGEMGAVGPRPLTAADVERLGWTAADHDFRWTVRPGLTGLAQLAGPESSANALALDRAYVSKWRPLLDCRLILLSFAVNAFGKTRVRGWIRGASPGLKTGSPDS